MASPAAQQFIDSGSVDWIVFGPGVELQVLAQPVPEGSIHRARLSAGTSIPAHTHPADEYVQVVSGVIETGVRRREAGTFWITPAGKRRGPHVAESDAELLTIRLGPMGVFEKADLR